MSPRHHSVEGEKWENEKRNQNIVTNEKLVKKNVMNAEIVPKVVVGLSIFNIGGYLQPSNQHFTEESNYENEPWLLIGIPNRDPFHATQYLERHSASSDHHMRKLMSLRECLHVMMQCYMQQHVADRWWLHEHPGGHAS